MNRTWHNRALQRIRRGVGDLHSVRLPTGAVAANMLDEVPRKNHL